MIYNLSSKCIDEGMAGGMANIIPIIFLKPTIYIILTIQFAFDLLSVLCVIDFDVKDQILVCKSCKDVDIEVPHMNDDISLYTIVLHHHMDNSVLNTNSLVKVPTDSSYKSNFMLKLIRAISSWSNIAKDWWVSGVCWDEVYLYNDPLV